MKTFYFTFLLVGFSLFSCSEVKTQSITDLFLLLPDECVDDLSVDERKQLLADLPLSKNGELSYFLDLDSQEYGIIYLNQSYTEGQTGFGQYEICYWECSDGSLLVAVSEQGGNRVEHFQNKLSFYRYKDSQMTKVDYKVFEEYSEDMEKMLASIIEQITNDDAIQEDKDNLRFHILFELPKEDSDLRVYYNIEGDFKSEENLNLFNETEISYEWMGDGTFKRR